MVSKEALHTIVVRRRDLSSSNANKAILSFIIFNQRWYPFLYGTFDGILLDPPGLTLFHLTDCLSIKHMRGEVNGYIIRKWDVQNEL